MPLPKRHNAFTLMEVMVVVVIIGVLAAMIVPNLGGQRGAAMLRGQAKAVQAMLRYAQIVSIGRGKETRVVFFEDEDGQSACRLEIEDPEDPTGFAVLVDGVVKPTRLGKSIQISQLMVRPGMDGREGGFAIEEGDLLETDEGMSMALGGGAASSGDASSDASDADPASSSGGGSGGGEVAIGFYPSGTADEAVVVLSRDRLSVSLLVDPNSGRVLHQKGVADFSPSAREDLDAF